MTLVDVNGTETYAHDGGVPWQPGRPAAVFIHGAGFDHTLWQQQSRALAQLGAGGGFNVAALDLPGHGRSADRPAIASVSDYAAFVAEFIEAAGLKPAALIGHSLGVAIALACAAEHPESVSALALVNSGLEMPVAPALLQATSDDPAKAVAFITSFAHGRASHIGHAPTPGSWLIGTATALLGACTPEVLHRDFAVCNEWKGAPMAARVTCPALVVGGRGDRMTPPKAGRALAEAIPGARFELLDGAGHMIPTEAPRHLLKLLQGFLATAKAA